MGENIEIGNIEFLTLSDKEPHKYRRHATLVLAFTSLLYGLFLVFPQFLYGYRGIEYAFRSDSTTINILRRLITYHEPIILGILLIILSGDIIRTGNILPRHIKMTTLFFIISGVKELSFLLIELSQRGVSAFIEMFSFHLGEPLLRYSLIFTMIAFSYFVSMSILLEKEGYAKKIFFVLMLYFNLSAINALYTILTPPSGPLYQIHWTLYLVGFLLAMVYFFRGYRGVGLLKGGVENVHWTLRGAIFLFGFDKLVWLGYNLVYRFSTSVGLVSELSGYGFWVILIFLVGSLICVSSLLPWKIVYKDNKIIGSNGITIQNTSSALIREWALQFTPV